MIMGFSKLFSDIIHSTVWREEMHVKVVWITMLAMADRHGQVLASIPGLADSAKVTLDECLNALEIFKSPDEYSRTKDFEGRRIIDVDGGWLLLNYEKFRERKDDEEQRIKTRERVRKHRELAKQNGTVTESVTVTPSNDIQRQITDTDTDTEEEIRGEVAVAAPARKKGTRLPDQFFLTSEMREYAKEKNPNADLALETEKFCNYFRAAPGQKGVKLNWLLTWKNWILNSKGNGTNKTNGFGRKQTPGEIIANRSYR